MGTPASHESVTVPQAPLRPEQAQRIPLLLVVGDAAAGGAPPARRILRVAAEGLEIGRHPDRSAIQAGRALALADSLISRLHCRLVNQPDGWHLDDAGSTNGTWIDGRRVDGSARLSNGSVILLGHHAAVFKAATETEIEAIEEDLADPLVEVATASPTLAKASRAVRRLARSPNDIMLLGQTGVGKEVYARAIHRIARAGGPFVALNCAAIPRELAESELFGHVKGAHSTAQQRKQGLVEAADGGTLFLDEIGDMPSEVQSKLLRFLQSRQVTPLGSTTFHQVNIKVVAATSRQNHHGELDGVRADLAARLGAQPLRLPPLRDRIEDLGALTHHFLRRLGRRALTPAAFQALCLYTWPCNVRELEKVVSEAFALSDPDGAIGLEHLPPSLHQAPGGAPRGKPPGPPRPKPTQADLEALLRQHSGNVAAVARALDRQWAVVWRWLRRHGIDPQQYRL
jgi:transcriptional regulator with PAS, ATPase and Fis domain